MRSRSLNGTSRKLVFECVRNTGRAKGLDLEVMQRAGWCHVCTYYMMDIWHIEAES